MYNFLGKDNVPFHSVIFPSCLLGAQDGYTIVNHMLATGQSTICWPQVSQPFAGRRSVNHMLATGQSTICWPQVSQPFAGHRSVNHLLAAGQSTTCWPQVSQPFAGRRSVSHMLAVGQSSPCHCSRDPPQPQNNVHPQFSSVLDVISVLGKAHIDSTPSLRSFPNVAFEIVPMFVWLMIALSCPFEENCLALPLSTPLSSHPQHRHKWPGSRTAQQAAVEEVVWQVVKDARPCFNRLQV